MKTINDFGDVLEYVHRLGFASTDKSPGWIVYAQQMLCAVTDALERTAGGYPYRVRFHRYRAHGFSYPWKSTFTIRTANGQTRMLECERILH